MKNHKTKDLIAKLRKILRWHGEYPKYSGESFEFTIVEMEEIIQRLLEYDELTELVHTVYLLVKDLKKGFKKSD